jgi:lipoate-protein ligase A
MRLIEHGAGDPAWNMAADEALLQLLGRDVVLRIYGWNAPAVTLGYFQPWTLAPSGRPFVRRYTGGGLVDHARDLTYTIVAPREHPVVVAGTAESYRILHEAVASALRACGVEAQLTGQELDGNAGLCFQKPVRYDIIAPDQSKLAGAAQRRNRHGVLHQGSILLTEGRPPESLRGALATAIAASLQEPCEVSVLTDAEETKASQLVAERYGLDSWNRMR